MIDLESCPKRKTQVVAQKAKSDWLLLNMENGNYFSLNDIGGRIWELCDGSHSVAQLVAALATEYDAPAEVLQQDVVELLEGLRNGKLIG
jgi:coenzyme PQQ biosynthesis protein PqqD